MQEGSILSFNVLRSLRSFAALLLLFGCSKKVAEPSSISEPELTRQYRQGSLTVVVSVSETNIASSGTIQLMLDVQAPPGAKVGFPELGYSIGPFAISDSYSEPLQTLPNGKILHRQIWQLVPSLPGEGIFQPLEITAGSARIKTKPIPVTVRSLLPEGLEAFEIKDIAAPATLLPEQRTQRHRGLILAGSAIAIALAIAFIRLRRKTKTIAMAPPHETAFQALENLPEDPVARLHELNRILCEYIEHRFTLPMIGKTTCEILPILENTNIKGLTPALTPALLGFFEHGEQVRFSNRVPDGFVEEAERIARKFVETTKREEPCG